MRSLYSFVIALIFVFTLNYQYTYAASFTLNTIEDGFYKKTSARLLNSDFIAVSKRLSSIMYDYNPITQNLEPWLYPGYEDIPLLKFDLSKNVELTNTLKTQKISSVKLNLYKEWHSTTTGSSEEFYPTQNKIFYSADDSWREGTTTGIDTSFIKGEPVFDNDNYLGSIIDTGISYSWSYANLDIVRFQEIINSDSQIITLGIKTFEDVTNNGFRIVYRSKECGDEFGLNQGVYAPKLLIETAPVPEPSPYIIGFIGFIALLGFKFKPTRNSYKLA